MNLNFQELIPSFFHKQEVLSNKGEGYNYFTKRPLHPFKSACYAPFKSLYFGHEGKVVACCQNRYHVLGTYPTQTIKEIWYGEKANELRETLKKNQFNLGCENCETRILSKNYKSLLAASYDLIPLDIEGFPTDMEFELSNTCNLECIMCSGDFSSLIRTKRENRPPIKQVYDNDFISQLRDFIPHLSKAGFFGGEPFLIDLYYDIWEEIASINPTINITVQTNGTVLNQRVKDILDRCNFQVNVSLDSVNNDNYSKIRMNGEWAKTQKNIEWFSNYCHQKKIQFGISICPLQQNWHELVDIVKFANTHRANAFIHQVVTPRHAALGSLSPNKLEKVKATIQDQLKAYLSDTEIASNNLKVLSDFLNEIQYLIGITQQTQKIANSILTVHDFYAIVEKKMQTDSLGYDTTIILDKLRKALKGLENNPEIIQKFRQLNIHNAVTWRQVLRGIQTGAPDHVRYEIINNM